MLPTSYCMQRTQEALIAFNSQKQSRVLLKVVDDGKGGRHLIAKNDSWLTRLDCFLHRTRYKLESITQFFNSKDFAFEIEKKGDIKAAFKKLDEKIDKHNTKYLAFLFNRIIHPEPSLDTIYEEKTKSAEMTSQIDTVIEQLFFPYTNPQELEPVKLTLDSLVVNTEHMLQMQLAHDIYAQKLATLQKIHRECEAPLNVTLAHIVPQKADGNCLLRSFAVGLYFADQFPEELTVAFAKPEDAHSHFRELATHYIENNLDDAHIKTLLTEAISEHNDSEKTRYEMEKKALTTMLGMKEIDGRQVQTKFGELDERYEAMKIDDTDFRKYIALSKNESFFCSTVHLYALSLQYSVDIKVFHKRGDRLEELPAVPSVLTAKATVSLYFNPSGPHYDAIRT